MKRILRKNMLSAVFVAAACFGHAGFIQAHDANGITMDVEGVSATFTGFAVVTCEGVGSITPTDYFVASIRDLSPPVDGLLVNLQIFKLKPEAMAINVTDEISGDSQFSDPAILRGGGGVYYIMVNKTGAGERTFDLQYHCQMDNGTHTETGDIGVLQFK